VLAYVRIDEEESGHSFFWLQLLSPEQAARPREAVNKPDLPPSDQLPRRLRRG